MATHGNKKKITDQELMKETIRQAKEQILASEGGPFGTIIAREDVIIAQGCNRVSSSNEPSPCGNSLYP
jgi:guanine deaminase